MIYACLLVMCILFIEVSHVLGLIPTVHDILLKSRNAFANLSSPTLNDMDKEIAARDASLALLKLTLLFILKLLTISALLGALYITFIYSTNISAKEFSNIAFSWSALVGLTIFAVVYVKIRYGHRE